VHFVRREPTPRRGQERSGGHTVRTGRESHRSAVERRETVLRDERVDRITQPSSLVRLLGRASARRRVAPCCDIPKTAARKFNAWLAVI
jgi:hypothetical protein